MVKKRDKILNNSSYSSMYDFKRQMLKRARTRAIKKGIPFNISIEDIVFPLDGKCPILRKKLKPNSRYAHSLDKINPSLGYVKGNVAVISTLANNMKADSNYQEMKVFVKNILKYMRDGRQ
jgi:hypothetical protein